MTQPPGYIDPRYSNHVYKLLKGRYGFKQAGRIWHGTITTYVEEIGFKTTLVDPCMFTQMVENQYIYLSLHIDDFLCVGTKTDCKSTIAVLQKWFKLKLTKNIVHLGIKILRKPDETLQIS
jgi:Reverse transcriptase (RNA-dependent DNA polymerase)